MEKKKYRFSLVEQGTFRVSTPHDVDNFDEFIKLLEDKRINRVTFKFLTILDDIPEFLDNGVYLALSDIQPWHFEWLINKSYGQHKFVEIDSQST